MNRSKNTAPAKHNRLARGALALSLAATTLAACNDGSSAEKQKPADTIAVMNEQDNMAKLNAKVEEHITDMASFLNKAIEDADPNVQVDSSENSEGVSSMSYLKYVKNSDGTLTRYYLSVEYSESEEQPWGHVEGLMVAVDTMKADEVFAEADAYGTDNAVHYMRMDNDNWRISTRTDGQENSTYYSTEPLRGAANESQPSIMWPLEEEIELQIAEVTADRILTAYKSTSIPNPLKS